MPLDSSVHILHDQQVHARSIVPRGLRQSRKRHSLDSIVQSFYTYNRELEKSDIMLCDLNLMAFTFQKDHAKAVNLTLWTLFLSLD